MAVYIVRRSGVFVIGLRQISSLFSVRQTGDVLITEMFVDFWRSKVSRDDVASGFGIGFENKKPKEPYIVHLSTMCHIVDGSDRAVIVFFYRPEKHKLGRRH